MANRSERAFGLTILSPITGGASADGVPHDRAIRRELRALGVDGESPFARVTTTHFARCVVIDTLPYEGMPAKIDVLKYKYLLFTSNFDGELDDYLELVRTRMPEAVERIWSHCIAFPGVHDRAPFAAYMKRCQVETSFFFGAYTTHTLDDVLRALGTQQRMARFVAEHQDRRAPAAALQRAFRELVGELSAASPPAPGTI